MRRIVTAVALAGALLALWTPNVGAAKPPPPPPPTGPAIQAAWMGVSGDIVGAGDCSALPCSIGFQLWNQRDGRKDGVVQLSVDPSSSVALSWISVDTPSINATGNHWDTIPSNGRWAVGVTQVKSRRLTNNSDTSYTADLTAGLTVNLHVDNTDRPNTFFTSGTNFIVSVGFSNGAVSTASFTT